MDQLFFIPSHEQFEWIIFEKFGHQEILKYDVFWAGPSSFTTFISDLASCLAVRVGTCSVVTSLIFHEKVIIKGIPFTNIKSAVKVTNLWSR